MNFLGNTKNIMVKSTYNLYFQVQLPENEVTLAAYTIPDERATMSHYNYVWTLVDQPKGGFTGEFAKQIQHCIVLNTMI